MSLKTYLELPAIRMRAHIGCGLEERSKLQDVEVGLKVEFLELPPACQTDQLKDTLCYDEIVKTVREQVQSNSYALLEKLAYEVFSEVRLLIRQTTDQTRLWLKVKKCNPPIEEVKEGSSFIISELSSDGNAR